MTGSSTYRLHCEKLLLTNEPTLYHTSNAQPLKLCFERYLNMFLEQTNTRRRSEPPMDGSLVILVIIEIPESVCSAPLRGVVIPYHGRNKPEWRLKGRRVHISQNKKPPRQHHLTGSWQYPRENSDGFLILKRKEKPVRVESPTAVTVVQTPTTPPGHRQPPITMCSIIPASESEAVDGLMTSCVKHEVINQSYRVARRTSKRRQSLNMMKERGYSIGHTRTTASYL